MGEYFTEQDLHAEFADPRWDLARGSVAVYDGPRMIGCNVLGAGPTEPAHVMNMWGAVHPAHRRRGLGTELLARSEQTALALHREDFADRPLVLGGFCDTRTAGAMALFAAA